ncbi:TetR family transcriptional regulator [Actinomycetospora straminea]|uniref:acyl-CoA-like ligand-binding transcription factor n=1 Tax=Actinomycetospora straminea TaxID=663607 RepID=UPI002366F4DD|nr:TetR family transcriptional regulator [Actinomycetospora straminea]MDD7932031.1 TetR family transcriptional regulator [Actinomycetospora straminea]
MTTRSARRVPVARRLEDVALELFATQGFDETTVDELALAGGVGRRTFFRYFPTKLDVVLGELDDGLAALASVLREEPGDDPVAAARAAFLAVNHYADAELPALRRRLGLIEDVPELAARATVRYRDWEQTLATDAAARWGTDPASLRAQVFGRAVVAAMRAVFSAWHVRPEADAAALGALVEEAFDALARGFSSP